MHLTLLDYALWFVTPLVQAGVLLVMWRRNLHSRYSRFFAYSIFQVVSVPVLAAVFARDFTWYYYGYFVNVGVTVLLSLMVVYEASRIVFDQDDESLRVLRFMWAVVLSVGVLLLASTRPASAGASGALREALILSDRALRIFQVVLVVGLAAFGARLRISSRSFVYGVLLGFGVYALTNTVTLAVAEHYQTASTFLLSRMNGIGYLAATVIWLAYSLYGSAEPGGLQLSTGESPRDSGERNCIERDLTDQRMSSVGSLACQ